MFRRYNFIFKLKLSLRKSFNVQFVVSGEDFGREGTISRGHDCCGSFRSFFYLHNNCASKMAETLVSNCQQINNEIH